MCVLLKYYWVIITEFEISPCFVKYIIHVVRRKIESSMLTHLVRYCTNIVS